MDGFDTKAYLRSSKREHFMPNQTGMRCCILVLMDSERNRSLDSAHGTLPVTVFWLLQRADSLPSIGYYPFLDAIRRLVNIARVRGILNWRVRIYSIHRDYRNTSTEVPQIDARFMFAIVVPTFTLRCTWWIHPHASRRTYRRSIGWRGPPATRDDRGVIPPRHPRRHRLQQGACLAGDFLP
jgi:hypothetical protein